MVQLFSTFFLHAPKICETPANESAPTANWIWHTSDYKRENLQGKTSFSIFFELCVKLLL